MKVTILALVTMLFAMESFAQVGPRYNPGRRGGGEVRHVERRVVRVDDRRVMRVGPRYNPEGSRLRSMRGVVRSWTYSPRNVLSCDSWTQTLTLNGRIIHDFVWGMDCQQAINDIRLYGDFCDGADLFDESGRYEARFTYASECRNALGWYY